MTTECTTERLEFGACEGSESSVDLTVGSSAQMVADCCCGLPFTHKSCRNAVAYRNRWSGPA